MREYNITELKNLIREAYLDLITENAESSNRKKARRLLKDKNYVTRDNFKAGDAEERIVINTLPDCVRYNHFKFAIFFYSLYYQYKDDVKVEKNADNENNEEYNEWKLINTYFYNILKEEGDNFNYARYLTDIKNYTLIPLQDLLKIIEEYNSNRVEDNNQDYSTSEYPYNGYKIIKILTFEQSKEYSKYCSWCVTNSKELYNRYTNYGKSCFHYCLRYDYKDTNEPLSMLAVLVDEKGILRKVTTRENNGDFYYKTEKEVKQHFGIDNFSSIFKPITEEEIKQAQDEEKRLKADYRKNIKKYLKQGHNIEDILRKAYSYFEYDNEADLFRINDKNKENYIDKQGKLLSKKWFERIDYDKEADLFNVKNGFIYNYIDKEGNLLSNVWYDNFFYDKKIDSFKVEYKLKYNYIDKEGNLLSNEWYDNIVYFSDSDLFSVKNNKKYNYIDKEGNLLFNDWYDEIEYVSHIDLFRIKNNKKYNYIDKEDNLLFNEWGDSLYYDYNLELFNVEYNKKNNYIDKEGVSLFNEWYDHICYNDRLKLFWAIKDNKEYYIDINENIVKEIKK